MNTFAEDRYPTIGADGAQTQKKTMDRLPVFRVDVTDKSGSATGIALGSAVKAKFNDLEWRWDTYLARVFSQHRFDRWLDEQINPEGLDPFFRDQVLGFADTLSLVGHNRLGDGMLSLDEFWLAQSAPVMDPLVRGSGFGVFGRRSSTNESLVGRNLDWSFDESLRGLQAITVYRSREGSVVTIGVAGFLGVITGFNDRGLFLAHLNSPLGLRDSLPTGDRVISFDLRHALETRASVSGAVRLLRSNRYGTSHNILMADRTRVQVLEQPQSRSGRLREATSATREEMSWRQQGQIAAVNCFVLRMLPANCRDLQDRYHWQRFRELARFEPDGPRARMSDLGRIMLDRAHDGYEIFNRHTIQSLVFATRTGELLLYATPEVGRQLEDPILYRYQDLARETGSMTTGRDHVMLGLWLLFGFMASLVLWIHLVKKRSDRPPTV